MANPVEPEDSAEVLWMLFSLLTIEPERILEILSDENALTEDGPENLVYVIQDRYVGWLDEFEPCPRAQQLLDLAWSMGGEQSYESFMTGDDWKQLRVLAKLALEEAGLEPWPLPPHIDLGDFVEIVP